MNFIETLKGRTYYAHCLEERSTGFLPFHGQEFVLLVCVDRGEFDECQLESVCVYLLESNVRYVVCTGSAAAETEHLFDRLIVKGDWDQKRESIVPTIAEPQMDEAVFCILSLAFPPHSNPKFTLLLFPQEDGRVNSHLASLKRQADAA